MLGTYDLSDPLFLFCLDDHNVWYIFLRFVVNLLSVARFLLKKFKFF